MKKLISIFLVFTLLLPQIVLAQTMPNDTYLLGQGSSTSDKGIVFNTGDGASNKKLVIEDTFKLKFDGNKLQFGDGALTADKELIFNSTSAKSLKYDYTNTEFNFNDDVTVAAGQKLKTNSIDAATSTVTSVEQDLRVKGKTRIGTGVNYIGITSGNIVFSNDGSLEKKLGSGSGSGSGGTPLNTNDSFEDGVATGYSSSGGTFTQLSYSGSPPDSDLKYASFVATISGQYFETSLVTTSQNVTGGCLASLDYYSTDVAGTWKLQVYDNSANLLAEQSLSPKDFKSGTAPFQCPTVGTQIKARVISTAAGTILSDHVYLGKENRTFQVAQAKFAGESYFAGTAACSWARTSTTVGALATVAACPGPTIVDSSMGSWQTTDSDLPRQTINSLPAGKYKATFQYNSYQATPGIPVAAINDGTTTCEAIQTSQSPTSSAQEVSCIFTYTSSGNRVFELYIGSSANAVTIRNDATAPRASTKFQLEFYPTESQTAIVPEAQDWFIDANIGGSNPSLGTSAQSAYIPISDATLDLVLRTGSATAKIPCVSGTTPTGLTCTAASEEIGVTFTPPQAGYYDVCMNFSHVMSLGASASVQAAFQLVETPVALSTITQEGGTRALTRMNNGSTNTNAVPVSICGNFYFASATERTVKLMYEQSVTATISTNTITADRDASNGQRDIRVTVRPTNTASNRPYLVGNQVETTSFTGTNQSLGAALTNGYQKLPGGLIIQWGYTSSVTASGTTAITFPIAFPNAAINVSVTKYLANNVASYSLGASDIANSGFNIRSYSSTASAATWFAIGY